MVEAIDAGAARVHDVADPTMDRGDKRVVEHPPRHPRLIRDHDDRAKPARFRRRTASTLYGKNAQPLEPIEISGFFYEVPSRSRKTAGRPDAKVLLH